MNTILFSGFAATALLMGAPSASAGDLPAPSPKAAPMLGADPEAYSWGEDSGPGLDEAGGSGYDYQGEWQGDFVDPQARIFEGQWRGRVVRHADAPMPEYGYDRSEMETPYRDADKQYHGDEYDGAEYYDGEDRRDRRDYERHERSSYRYSHAPQHGGYGWQGGYYYPQAPMITTVTIMPGFVTTSVTEETTYETVHTAPRRKAVRKWKPKAKPRCICR